MEDNRRNTPPDNNGGKPNGKKPKTNFLTLFVIALAIVLIGSGIFNSIQDSQYQETTWADFRAAMAAGELAEVEIRSDRVLYMTKQEAAKDAKDQKACYTGLPSGDIMGLADELDAMGVEVKK